MAEKFVRLFLSLAMIGAATGILVGPVSLVNSTYITYQLPTSEDYTLLKCPVVLKEGEVLSEVSWTHSKGFHDEIGHFVWSKDSGGSANGTLKDVVLLDRNDGSLEFTELRYDLAGYYSCAGKATNGDQAETSKWELLIVDTTANRREDSVHTNNCKLMSTFKVYPIFPEPTVHSGLFSEAEGGFVEEVSAVDWHKQKYPNGSYSYSYTNVTFEIDADTPLDVTFVTSVGVTKADGIYIPITSVTSFQIDKRGCPLLKTKAYQKITYNSATRSCRQEVVPGIGTPLTATVGCVEGYKSASSNETIVMTCNENTWTWGVTNGKGLIDIKCVYNSSTEVAASSLLIMAASLLLRLLQQ